MSETHTLKLMSSCSVSSEKEANTCHQSNLSMEAWAMRASRDSIARWHLLAPQHPRGRSHGGVLGQVQAGSCPHCTSHQRWYPCPSSGGIEFAEGRVLDRSKIEMRGGEFKFHLSPPQGR